MITKNLHFSAMAIVCRTLAASVCTMLLLAYVPANAEAAAKVVSYDLDIPSQDLHSALQQLAAASRHKLLYKSVLVAEKVSSPVKGSFTAQEAIRLALYGTDLTFEITADSVVLIKDSIVGKAGEQRAESAVLARADAQSEEAESGRVEGSAPMDRTTDAASNTAAEVEEIVVTAQKRQELLKDVPVSISVLTSKTLERQGIVQLSDYATQVPGLVIANAGSGPGQGRAIIRGISTGGDANAVVGMYLDDVSFTSNANFNGGFNIQTLDPDLADVERIEVLKGPQSTLYGANALGGIVKIITRQPDLENWEGRVQIDGTQVDGGGGDYGVRGTVNIPIAAGRLALRATVFDRRDPGFVDNLATGQKNINRDTVKGGRASLRIKLTDKFETTFSGYLQDIAQSGLNTVLVDEATYDPVNGLAYSSPIFLASSNKNRGFSNTISFDMNFATLTNIASFTRTAIDGNADYSAFAGFVQDPPTPPGSGVQVVIGRNTTRYSDELRLASAPGRMEWRAGAFYTREKFDFSSYNLYLTDPSGVIIPTSSPDYRELYTVQSLAFYKEYAAFGDLTYHFTDRIEATVGARYSHNDQPFSASATGYFAPSYLGQSRGAGSDSAVTHLGTVVYKLKPNLTIYARAASAYNPGGTQVLVPGAAEAGLSPNFDPATLWNYEIGSKGTFWNGRGSFEAAVYHMDWSDIQLTVGVNNFALIANAASAASDGAEVAFHLSPVDGLTLGISGAYNDATLTSDVPSAGLVSGTRLPRSQKTSVAVSTDYLWPVTSQVSAFSGLTYSYRSKSSTGLNLSGSYVLPSFRELNLRTGLEWSRYTLTLHVDNVTNEFGVTDVGRTLMIDQPFQATVIAPRSFGLSFAARF